MLGTAILLSPVARAQEPVAQEPAGLDPEVKLEISMRLNQYKDSMEKLVRDVNVRKLTPQAAIIPEEVVEDLP